MIIQSIFIYLMRWLIIRIIVGPVPYNIKETVGVI